MIVDYRITRVTKKPFKTTEGGMKDYFWYKAIRLSDDVEIEFGSTAEHMKDEEVTLELVKREGKDGRLGWREIVTP